MSDDELRRQQTIELGYLRESMVRVTVQRKVNRNPDADDETIDEWERDAYRRWRETYPALSMLFTSVLPSEAAS